MPLFFCVFPPYALFREAAKKAIFLMAGLNGIRIFYFFVVKYLETDLDDFFSSPNFRTKIALFFRKYCYNPVKILADKFFNATAMFYILYDCDDLNHKAVRPLHSCDVMF